MSKMNFGPDLLPKPAPKAAPKARAKEGDVGRRSFIKLLSALTAGAIAMPNKAEAFNLDEFLQKHFHQMTDEEKQKTMARLEGEYNEKYSRDKPGCSVCSCHHPSSSAMIGGHPTLSGPPRCFF